jgi:Uncharacterised protein family (UPF0175)
MHIALDIPDNIPGVVAPDHDPARATLEAMALDGYRSQRLSEYDARELLGFTTPMQVHGFLKEHGFTCTNLHYSRAGLDHDIREYDRIVAVLTERRSSGEQPAG